MKNYSCENEKKDDCVQTHVHEFLGSVKIAEIGEDPHNHRFAGVSEKVIKVPGGHIHKIFANTDFYEDHYHEICVVTGTQFQLCDGRHVHFAKGTTTVVDDHAHDFIFATLIEDPIGE